MFNSSSHSSKDVIFPRIPCHKACAIRMLSFRQPKNRYGTTSTKILQVIMADLTWHDNIESSDMQTAKEINGQYNAQIGIGIVETL